MSFITTLSIKGMTCSSCSGSIKSQLLQQASVEDAQVSLITEEGIVRHTNGITPDEIKDIIEDSGFDATVINTVDLGTNENDLYRTRVKILGMTCSNCTNSIKSVIEPKVSKFDISLITEEAIIEHHIDEISKDDIVEMIEDCGFSPTLIESTPILSGPHKDVFQTTVNIKGMTCGACTSSIESVLLENSNVLDCNVSLVTEQAIIKHHTSLTATDIKDMIEDCGFDVEIVENVKFQQDQEKGQNIETTKFNIKNYDGSLDQVNNVVLPGILTTSFVSENVLSITYNPEILGVRTLTEGFLDQIGLVLEPQTIVDSTNQQIKGLQKLDEIRFWKRGFCITGIVGFPMFVVDHIFPALTGKELSYHLVHGLYLNSLLELIFASYIQFTIGKFFYRNSMNSFKHGSGTMDSLIFISTNISYYFSILAMVVSIFNNNTDMAPHTLFETAVLLMNFVSLGKWLECKAKSETSTSLSKLLSLTSTECTIISKPEAFTVEKPGETKTIPISYLQIRDIVSIKPGEKIPADGIIIHGESEIDESLLTGESLPIYKKVNDKIYGGSINGPGHLYVLIKITSENSQLSKIIKLVKFAQLQKAPIQSFADYIASIFVPAVLVLSLITFVCWLILCNVLDNPPDIFNNKNGKFFTCLKIAISVIVVACPCALGLAAPTAIMVGTGVGASNGVLIKGGDVLEVCNDIDVFLFDKTGTLTLGEMNVHVFNRVNKKIDEDLVLSLIGTLENKSEHPIGEAIVSHVKKTVENFQSNNYEVSKFEVLIGKGLSGVIVVDNVEYSIKVGNLKIFDEKFLAQDPTFSNLRIDSDLTLAHVAINDEYIGYLELKDTVKSDTRKVLNYLKSLGYEVAMVTGDSTRSARRISKDVGIPIRNVFADISPYGKEQLVAELQSKRGLKVAFIGDGLNDSPALAKADLGIAIASGTDIAIEAADIVILNSSSNDHHDFNNDRSKGTLQNVLNAVEISQRTLKRIKWNFFWSSVYNLTMVPIAMGVLIPWGIQLSPMFAGFAMAFSSVSVVLSSLLLKRWKPRILDDVEYEEEGENFDLESGVIDKKKRWSFRKSVRDVLKIQKKRNVSDLAIELDTGLLTHDNL
jgi:Cu+-exporting ATPase